MQARFHVPELEALHAILGEVAADDPELQGGTYQLESRAELESVVATFDVQFDPGPLKCQQIAVRLARFRRLSDVPYLVHTGYELPLLLDGRKKPARMYHEYPADGFEGEERFDHWVAQCALHRVEVLEPFDRPIRQWLGIRTVYYTPKIEEWRIPAFRLLWNASVRSGGWNAYFERLEGMLYGYENWQNDWWINTGLSGGGFGGVRLCCAVTAAGLDWIEAAGYRALPPVDRPTLTITNYDASDAAAMCAFMLKAPDAAALVVINVFGGVVSRLLDRPTGPPWHVPREKVPELNRQLRQPIAVVARNENIK